MDEVRSLARPCGALLAYAVQRPERVAGALVLLHGLASNMTRWSEFAERTSLKRSWLLLRPDLRGQGRSLWRGRASMAEWCADLAALLDAQGCAQAVLAGHCLGANLALEFAARCPARVAGLVLVEPMPREALAGTMRRLAALRPLLFPLAWLARALNALGLHRRRFEPLDLRALDRETRAALASGPEGEARLRRYASPLRDLRTTPLGAYLQALIALTGPLPDLARIGAPALALLAAGGTFSDPQRTRAALARMPRCEIVQLPARHWIPTEQPEAMRAAIENWLGRLAPG
jgi:pimeloyl-ACP methyl ester carboxylesterase